MAPLNKVLFAFRRCSLKKFAILSATTLLLGSCSAAAISDESSFGSTPVAKTVLYKQHENLLDIVINKHIELTMLQAQIEQKRIDDAIAKEIIDGLYKNKIAIEDRINELSQYIGKTRYVFSGSSPSGWDCSGLVRWFYEGLNHELPHSATKQGMLKPKVTNPLPGDIVVFKYKNAKNFIHSAIYIGNNEVIHSGFGSGDRTEIISLDDAAFASQDYYFVRIMETE